LNGHTIMLNGGPGYSQLQFLPGTSAAQTLAGPGQLVLAGANPVLDQITVYGQTASPVTFAANVSVKAAGGTISDAYGQPAGFQFLGTMSVGPGAGTLTLSWITNKGS